MSDDSTGRAPASGRQFQLAALIVTALVAGVFAAVVTAALTDSSEDGAAAEARSAERAAARFTETFLSFEHTHIDEWKDDVLALSTGAFANEVEDVESGLRALIEDSQVDAVTEVTAVFIGRIERGAVDVVLIYDRTIRDASGTRTEQDRYMQLSMVRVDGVWLVDHVVDVLTSGATGLTTPQ